MLEQTIDKPDNLNRLLLVSLVLALSLANSSLLYFVLWDMLSPSKPFWVVLFTISGAAHVIYLFLPWLLGSLLGPLLRRSNAASSQFSGARTAETGDSGYFFTKLCAQVGILLCGAAIGLWLLQVGLNLAEEKLGSDHKYFSAHKNRGFLYEPARGCCKSSTAQTEATVRSVERSVSSLSQEHH